MKKILSNLAYFKNMWKTHVEYDQAIFNYFCGVKNTTERHKLLIQFVLKEANYHSF